MTAVLFDFGVFLLVFGSVVGVVSLFARTGEYAEHAEPRGEEI
jgi:hypothetical protein